MYQDREMLVFRQRLDSDAQPRSAPYQGRKTNTLRPSCIKDFLCEKFDSQKFIFTIKYHAILQLNFDNA